VQTTEGIIDAGGGRYASLREALADEDWLGRIAQRGATHAATDVRLLPPIPEPPRIICVGLNYRAHIAESGREAPPHPILFARFPDSLVGHGEALIRPIVSEQFDFEGELAFVIGRPGRHVKPERALDHVAGYCVFNDGSVRDYQRHTTQFMPGKTFHRSGSAGPWLMTPDEAPPVAAMEVMTRLNGQTMQRAPLSDLLFGVEDLIAYASRIWPLQPGDVFATGTPAGVGAFRKPPVWMKPGDTIEVEIRGVGVLRNPIVDEQAQEAA
jgi:2-keto-4-pentenoate hydratase/2-oxohepta-3-ene-1,7-dioic acid hydratase in catechol pathway